jgi:hypothetical protein
MIRGYITKVEVTPHLLGEWQRLVQCGARITIEIEASEFSCPPPTDECLMVFEKVTPKESVVRLSPAECVYEALKTRHKTVESIARYTKLAETKVYEVLDIMRFAGLARYDILSDTWTWTSR